MTTETKWPQGALLIRREQLTLPPEYMQMLAALAETSSVIDVGLHCSRCKETLSGKNATSDTRWIMECACRTFIGANPLVRAN